jgi:two-component system nitrate/nitrite response regulator NarL
LADDHRLVREGLREALEQAGMTVVGEAQDGTAAAALALELAPDVVLLDLRMPGMSGTEATRRIISENDRIKVIVVTVSAEASDVIQALASGACGYVLKDMRLDDLIAGIRQAASGHAVLSREAMRALTSHVRAHAATEREHTSKALTLTAREREVLALIADGADNAAIGRDLSISKHTVKQYVTNILEKLEVSSRVEAAVLAVRDGLL